MSCHKIIVFVVLFGSVAVLSFDPDDSKVLGGIVAADPEDFPYQVSLRYVDNDDHFCGGSILDAHHILTAAHCFYIRNSEGAYTQDVHEVRVVAGQINLTLTEESIIQRSEKIIIHPDIPANLLANDLAIIRVQKPFDLEHPYTTKVNLASGDEDFTKCSVSGWGATETKRISEQLLYTPLELLPAIKCQETYEKHEVQVREDSMLCAGWDDDKKHDSCTGDSGGPLICNGLLVGVVSFGFECSNPEYAGGPGIYMKVSHYKEWIEETIRRSVIKKDEL